MRYVARLAGALSLLVLSACATIDSGSFVDRAIDFRQYRTYNWATPDRQWPGDARLEKDASFRDRMQGEIEKQLAAKGFKGPTSRKPDLLVRYRAATTPRLHVPSGARQYDDHDTYDDDHYYGYCSIDCSSRLEEYDAATLVVDLIDARSRKVVWRGWARDDVASWVDNPDRMARKVREAVAGLMTRLPSRA